MKNPVVIIIAILLLLVAFLVYTGTPYISKGYSTIKGSLGVVAGPVLKGVTAATGAVGGVIGSYINLVNAKKENAELKKRVEKLQIENQKMADLEKENQRLKGLLAFMQQSPNTLIGARVIGEDLKNWYKCIIIDKGKAAGIKERMTVITARGLVGQVVEIQQWHSKVMVINDTNSSVDVAVEGKNTRGILEGTGQTLGRLKYVRKTDEAEAGDKLVTSGKDTIFPKGIPVGLITTVTRGKTGIFSDIDVMPFNDFKKLEEVLVVKRP